MGASGHLRLASSLEELLPYHTIFIPPFREQFADQLLSQINARFQHARRSFASCCCSYHCSGRCSSARRFERPPCAKRWRLSGRRRRTGRDGLPAPAQPC
eukprot:6213582-Pleurochrysis_carterae.AAC.5